MKLLWLCVASLLHIEMALMTMLTIPCIPSTVWSMIFKCQFSRKIQSYSKVYSSIIVGLLLVLFIDSIWDMVKYSEVADAVEEPNVWSQNGVAVTSSRLFKAERNFYLLGATLFLFLSIHRTIGLINSEAQLIENGVENLKKSVQNVENDVQILNTQEKTSSKSKKLR